jgi:hypothetical protein
VCTTLRACSKAAPTQQQDWFLKCRVGERILSPSVGRRRSAVCGGAETDDRVAQALYHMEQRLTTVWRRLCTTWSRD